MPSIIPPLSFYQPSSPDDNTQEFGNDVYNDDDIDKLKTGSEQEFCLKAEESEDKENDSACPSPSPLENYDSMQSLMGNVDVGTNHLKSCHVAEKVLDKQLNLAEEDEGTLASETSKQFYPCYRSQLSFYIFLFWILIFGIFS